MSNSDASQIFGNESPPRKMLQESINENTLRRSTRKSVLEKRKAITEKIEHVETFLEDKSIVDINERNHFKEQLEEQEDVDGKTVFGFHTPKKKDGMALTAALAIFTPKTPRTPNIGRTSDAKHNRNELALKTPKHIRSKFKKGIYSG